MIEEILEIFGELLLSSKRVKPWIKITFAGSVLLVLAAILVWGVYMEWHHAGVTAGTIILSLLIAAALMFGFWYTWKCHRNNWEKY